MKSFQQLVESKLETPIADFLQSKIHESFTVAADKLAQLGLLSVEDRIAISSCIGDTLQEFRDQITKKVPTATTTIIPADIIMQLTFEE
jgi:hypothetical protein